MILIMILIVIVILILIMIPPLLSLQQEQGSRFAQGLPCFA